MDQSTTTIFETEGRKLKACFWSNYSSFTLFETIGDLLSLSHVIFLENSNFDLAPNC